MLEAPEILAASVALFLGSAVVSTVGFGYGMIASPLLLLFVEPQTVVVTINSVVLALFVLITYRNRSYLSVRTILPISLAGLAGVPFGVWALSSVDASVLRVSIAGLILLLALVAVLRVRWPSSQQRALGPLIGFVVGALVAALGIGGPFLALLLLSRGWSSGALRASMAFYFLFIKVTAVVGYGVAGLYTSERLVLILVVALPALAGFVVGALVTDRIDEALFRKAVLAVITVGSIMVLAREVLSIQGAV